MVRVTLPFPVMPGKTDEDVLRIAERFKQEPEEYAESRRRAGVTMERAYMQKTPMGTFVVAYIEAGAPLEDSLGGLVGSDLDIDRFFVETVKEVHGIDLAQPMSGRGPEVVGEWVDPAATGRGRGMAFCAPMNPDMEDRGRAWAKETFSSEGMTSSRRALGENIEVVTLVRTPQGPVCAIYLEGTDPFEANRRFAASTDPFDLAFKEELKQLFPPYIDFGQPVPGITEIFDSSTLPAAR